MTISEGLPRSLATIVQRLSQYQANTLKITPINSKDFAPGSVCSIRLPQYKVIDLHSIALLGHLVTTGAEQICGPGFGAGLIQRISVSCNGVQIGSGASSYNEVIAMLESVTMGAEKRRELSVLENYTSDTWHDARTPGLPWMVNGFHGTILGGTHQRFLDTGALGTVQLDIQFAQPQVLGAATVVVDVPTYVVNDVAMYVRTIDFGNGLYQAMIQKKVASSGMVIPFKQYITALSTSNSDTDHTIHVGSQCIDAVWTMFKPVGYQAAQARAHVNVQLSTYFNSGHLMPAGGNRDAVKYNLVINNTQLPTFPSDYKLAYYLMKQGLNGTGRNHLYTNCIADLSDWVDRKFVFMQSLEHGAELGEVPTLSGLDTLANPVPITVRVQGRAPAHTAVLVVETTSQCIINEGQIVGYLQ